jgi:hypothetical protein
LRTKQKEISAIDPDKKRPSETGRAFLFIVEMHSPVREAGSDEAFHLLLQGLA